MHALLALTVVVAAAPSRVAEEIVQQVQDRFYDPARATPWAERHRALARQLKTAEALEAWASSALAELGASHTAYFPPGSVENAELRSLFGAVVPGRRPVVASIGVDVALLPEGAFVRRVFAGGPAERAGVLRGDRIFLVDGKPFVPRGSLRGRDGKPLRLTLERVRGAPPIELNVTPRRIEPLAEWLASQEEGSRLIDHGGRRVAYHHLYSCAGPKPVEVMQRMMTERFQHAHALVLDLRDGWGGCPPELVNVFARRVPTLTFGARDGSKRHWVTGWNRPVVLLVNQNSRSGKELVAYAFRKHRLGPVVGTRTGGAFLAGKPVPLPDGGLLYLAVEDVWVDGERLEGAGVAPDVEVGDLLPYAAGADPQLDRAVELAAGLR